MGISLGSCPLRVSLGGSSLRVRLGRCSCRVDLHASRVHIFCSSLHNLTGIGRCCIRRVCRSCIRICGSCSGIGRRSVLIYRGCTSISRCCSRVGGCCSRIRIFLCGWHWLPHLTQPRRTSSALSWSSKNQSKQ